MRSFRHVHARSLREACRLLETHGSKARLNAGGTDLLGLLKDGILPKPPELLVNLKTLPGLDGCTAGPEGARIGALVRLSRIQESPEIREHYPLLSEAARSVGTPQLRNMGTLGGNLCQEVRCWYYRYPQHLGGTIPCLRKGGSSCPAVRGDNRYHAILGGKGCFAASPSDMAVALMALDASLTLVAPEGTRNLMVEEFYHPLGTVLEPGEIVTAVAVPGVPAGARQVFSKFTIRKPVDFAIASVAAVVCVGEGVCTHARVALGGVAPVPVRARRAEEALLGKALDERSAAQAAAAAVAGAKPLKKNAYKVEITKALVERALLLTSSEG
jgi:xanthine dehydrogenase YagS FAD-binding subunit